MVGHKMTVILVEVKYNNWSVFEKHTFESLDMSSVPLIRQGQAVSEEIKIYFVNF